MHISHKDDIVGSNPTITTKIMRQEKEIREIDGIKISVTWFKSRPMYFEEHVINNNENLSMTDLVTRATNFAERCGVTFEDVLIGTDFDPVEGYYDSWSVEGKLHFSAQRMPTEEDVTAYVAAEVEKIRKKKQVEANDRQRKKQAELDLYKKLQKKYGKK